VTPCEKVVSRLNKHDDVVECKFMKIAPTEMKRWLCPWSRCYGFKLSFWPVQYYAGIDLRWNQFYHCSSFFNLFTHVVQKTFG